MAGKSSKEKEIGFYFSFFFYFCLFPITFVLTKLFSLSHSEDNQPPNSVHRRIFQSLPPSVSESLLLRYDTEFPPRLWQSISLVSELMR